MAELYTTLGQSTLASGYTAGSGSLAVTSAASFPATGTFSVVVDPLARRWCSPSAQSRGNIHRRSRERDGCE